MKEVLAKIKPTTKEQQQLKAGITLFLKKLNARLKGAYAILGGSGAKDTWLSGSYDVDIFVLFEYHQFASRTSELSDLLQLTLKKCFSKIRRLHGSRDYFQLKYKNLNVEVIPILKITTAEHAKNITDVSPLHSVWVNQHTKKLKDDIRLAKQFLKAHNLYGAESHIRGFSGYVIEILIAYYGSLEKLLRASQSWSVKEIIDAAKHYPTNDVLFQLNKSKTQSPLIVIDPVDKNRNAAAALSDDAFFRFKKLAREYLKKPDSSFFVKKKIDLAQLRKETKLNIVYVTLAPFSGKEDVVGTKLLKVFTFLQQRLKPFVLKKSGWEWDIMYFLVEKKELPKEEVVKGPPLGLKEHVKNFRKKHKHAFEENGRLMARIPVKYPQLQAYVTRLVKEKYVQRYVRKVKGVRVL
ncbi:CCA tRNA nucleotidyltransferase [Candidatus Woesearchaeota archaeon]|nr:CCA tRNA nucleotidyltransferase [Candidatus Woesearchaeota archaeon]